MLKEEFILAAAFFLENGLVKIPLRCPIDDIGLTAVLTTTDWRLLLDALERGKRVHALFPPPTVALHNT